MQQLPDGRIVAAGIAGEILVSEDKGSSFTLSRASGTVGPIFDLTAGKGKDDLIVAGPAGIRMATLEQ